MSAVSQVERAACGLFCAMLCGVTAHSRQADGALNVIIAPNDGVPAIASPGHSFQAILTEQAVLTLRAGRTSHPLEVIWESLRGGLYSATCAASPGTPPGTYSLVAETPSQIDINPRSVGVYSEFPESYTVAHMTDTHVGRGGTGLDRMQSVVAAINGSDAAFVLFTGDLTEHGSPEEFRQVLKTLGQCAIPTFVSPGEHDRIGGQFERFFGPSTYAFRFGEDGYLAFDTSPSIHGGSLGSQSAHLQRLRRSIKSSRWTIGFTHRYEIDLDMRLQLILFVDNPIDFLVFGHGHREPDPTERIVPWPHTLALTTPAALDGAYRLVEITPTGPRPSATQFVRTK